MGIVEQIQKLPPGNVAAVLSVVWLVYLAALAIYRLYFSPLAKFPGPKLAALSKWYEFYYEVVLKGHFTFKIRELHKKYGPIVRITPEELHIDDYTFWDTLYVKHPKSSKYEWLNGRFGTTDSIFTTSDPAHHRMRRAPLNPMFSRRAITQQETFVQDRLAYLCEKLVEYEKNERIVPLQKMWSALACDVVTQYTFGFNYNQLGSEDFVDTFHQVFLDAGLFGNIALQFPWVGKFMKSLPDNLVVAINPSVKGLVNLTRDLRNEVTGIVQEHDLQQKPKRQTIFHEVLQSNLPPEEKTPRRLAEEIQTVIGAGLVTTAWAITVAIYYLLDNPQTLEKLRTELFAAVPDLSAPDAFSYQKLEPLSYLRGCVREGIRLSYGVSCRMPRLLDTSVAYRDWIIPPDTPISMTILDVHFNDVLYPKPYDFVPERWIGNPKAPDGESLEKYWVAFGKGPRNCLGINMAYLEVTIALATFFRRFRSKLYETDISDVELKHDFLIPSPKLDSKGVRVKIIGVET